MFGNPWLVVLLASIALAWVIESLRDIRRDRNPSIDHPRPGHRVFPQQRGGPGGTLVEPHTHPSGSQRPATHPATARPGGAR